MPLIKDPPPDPRVDPFRRGVATLSRDGVLHGHLFSTVEWLWSPSSPLRKQWWVWYVVAWFDGTRDDPQEDYPPWVVVDEINGGRYELEDHPHAGIYKVAWLPADDASKLRESTASLTTASDYTGLVPQARPVRMPLVGCTAVQACPRLAAARPTAR